MSEVSLHEAQTQLTCLLRRVAAGETITILQAGRPVAQLVPIMSAQQRERPLDTARGLLTVPTDFNAPLPAYLLASFEGGGA